MPTELSQPAAGQQQPPQKAQITQTTEGEMPRTVGYLTTSTQQTSATKAHNPMGWAELLFAQERCFVLGYN